MASKKKVVGKRSESAMPTDREKILGLVVNTLGRSIMWSLSRRTARHGVLPGAYPIIAWLMQMQDSTQGELSRIIGIEQPTMAITLRRMERDGIIQRGPDRDHGRRSRVKLTTRGKELSKIIRRAAYEVEEMASKGLSAAEVDQFFRLARVMIGNLRIERRGPSST
jgi:MarR family transcriptional regulator for hemolysin